MPHYLTPAKIGLLCLARIYAEQKCSKKAVVPLLSLIMDNLLPLESTSLSSSLTDETTGSTLIEQAKCMLADAPSSSSSPKQSAYDLFLTELWTLQCLDFLEDFIDKMPLFVQKTREELLCDRDNGVSPDPTRLFSRSSPVGVFIRKCQLEYTKLQFQEVAELWSGFVQFRLQTLQSMTAKQRRSLSQLLESDLLGVGSESAKKLASVAYRDSKSLQTDGCTQNALDFERLYEFQVSRMQSNGSRLPAIMRNHFKRSISTAYSLPENLSHYIQFLDSWRAGDYNSSFNHLHRYFDFTMQKRDRSFYQYALLNLAILQADFSCHAEAVAAIQETISTARELHDTDCLNFAMSWLYHFSKVYPDELQEVRETGMLGSEKENLAFLHAKARESESWSLLATSYLSEGKLMLQNGESIAAAFEALIKVANLNMSKYVEKAFAPQTMLYASVFDRLGVSHLSWLGLEVFETCYPVGGAIDDIQQIYHRKAMMLVSQGDIEGALQLTKKLPSETLPLKCQQHARIFEGIAKFDFFLNRNDLTRCEHILDDLKACTTWIPEESFAINLREVNFLIRKGDCDLALEVIQQYAASMRQETFDVAVQVKLLNLKAFIFEKLQQPERGFSLVMRAASVAFRSRFYPGLWEAVSTLSSILMSLREFRAAVDILESITPQVFAYDSVELKARVCSLLADGNMGLAGQAKTDRELRDTHLEDTIDSIEDCLACLEVLGDLHRQCEMMAKKAMALRALGDFARTEETATEYLELQKQAQSRTAAQRI